MTHDQERARVADELAQQRGPVTTRVRAFLARQGVLEQVERPLLDADGAPPAEA